jgi:hypothetical protein
MLPHLGERDLGDHGIISTRMTARCLSKVAHSEPAVELDLPGFSSARLDWLYAQNRPLYFADCEQF